MAEGFMWSSGQPVAAAIKAGYFGYVHRHARFPTWCRMRMEARQELTEQDLIDIVMELNLILVTVTTLPPGHFMFGVNGGGQDTGELAQKSPQSTSSGTES